MSASTKALIDALNAMAEKELLGSIKTSQAVMRLINQTYEPHSAQGQTIKIRLPERKEPK